MKIVGSPPVRVVFGEESNRIAAGTSDHKVEGRREYKVILKELRLLKRQLGGI
ncbi:hypothetical protein DFP95_101648 [Cohnella lupini]|uniref:Uncharacterized protein n=1 Tax=Cohnella lupini TaxID=1294267 RepID=A0A3D9IWE4_9BACL|nr:hypothetical protein DFP95_101648 [Cohnella lupini]